MVFYSTNWQQGDVLTVKNIRISKIVEYDSAYGALFSPTKTGYTFGGWFNGTGGTGTQITESSIHRTTSNLTLYAKWNINTYTITDSVGYYDLVDTSSTHNTNVTITAVASDNSTVTLSAGGTTTTNGTITISKGQTFTISHTYNPNITIRITFTRTNTNRDYHLWHYNSAGHVASGTNSISGDWWTPTYSENWTYFVREYVYFAATAKTGVNSVSVSPSNGWVSQDNNGETSARFIASVKDGYTFRGWYTAEDGSGTTLSTSADYTIYKCRQDYHLYAYASPNTYTVAYHRWNENSSATAVATSSHTYDTAKALSTYAAINTATSNALVVTGYTFAGWAETAHTSSPLGTVKWTDGQSVKNLVTSGTKHMYATYTADTFTIAFNGNKPSGASANVGGATASVTATYGSTKALTANGFSLTGWTFTGWATSASGAKVYDNSATLTAAQVNAMYSTSGVGKGGTYTLYAKWSANTYTVKFNANFPTWAVGKKYNSATYNNEAPTQSFTYDAAATALNANPFSSVNATFQGWNTQADGNGTNYANQASVRNLATSGTFNLYGKWAAGSYNISYSMGSWTHTTTSSSWATSYTFSQNSASSALGIGYATRTGYTFTGWTVAWSDSTHASGEASSRITISGSGTAYTIVVAKETYGHITLSPVGRANNYTVVFNQNKPSGASHSVNGTMANQSFVYDTAQNLTTNAYTLQGWTFKGWAISAGDAATVTYTDGQSVTNLTTIDGSQVDLYAVWNANKYTVKYWAWNSTGTGTPLATETNVLYDSYITMKTQSDISSLAITGYTFLGWTDVAHSSTKVATQKWNAGSSQRNFTDVDGATVNLFACYRANTYTVRYCTWAMGANTDGKKDVTHTYDVAKNLESFASLKSSYSEFDVTGYEFIGWATTAHSSSKTGVAVYSNGQSVTNLTATDGAIIRLFATYKPNTYTVEYRKWNDAGSGTAVASSTFVYNNDTSYYTEPGQSSTHKTGETALKTYSSINSTTSNSLEVVGYTFYGWTKTAHASSKTGSREYTDGQTLYNSTTTSNLATSGTLKLYALYTANKYTIKSYIVASGLAAGDFVVSGMTPTVSGGVLSKVTDASNVDYENVQSLTATVKYGSSTASTSQTGKIETGWKIGYDLSSTNVYYDGNNSLAKIIMVYTSYKTNALALAEVSLGTGKIGTLPEVYAADNSDIHFIVCATLKQYNLTMKMMNKGGTAAMSNDDNAYSYTLASSTYSRLYKRNANVTERTITATNNVAKVYAGEVVAVNLSTDTTKGYYFYTDVIERDTTGGTNSVTRKTAPAGSATFNTNARTVNYEIYTQIAVATLTINVKDAEDSNKIYTKTYSWNDTVALTGTWKYNGADNTTFGTYFDARSSQAKIVASLSGTMTIGGVDGTKNYRTAYATSRSASNSLWTTLANTPAGSKVSAIFSYIGPKFSTTYTAANGTIVMDLTATFYHKISLAITYNVQRDVVGDGNISTVYTQTLYSVTETTNSNYQGETFIYQAADSTLKTNSTHALVVSVSVSSGAEITINNASQNKLSIAYTNSTTNVTSGTATVKNNPNYSSVVLKNLISTKEGSSAAAGVAEAHIYLPIKDYSTGNVLFTLDISNREAGYDYNTTNFANDSWQNLTTLQGRYKQEAYSITILGQPISSSTYSASLTTVASKIGNKSGVENLSLITYWDTDYAISVNSFYYFYNLTSVKLGGTAIGTITTNAHRWGSATTTVTYNGVGIHNAATYTDSSLMGKTLEISTSFATYGSIQYSGYDPTASETKVIDTIEYIYSNGWTNASTFQVMKVSDDLNKELILTGYTNDGNPDGLGVWQLDTNYTVFRILKAVMNVYGDYDVNACHITKNAANIDTSGNQAAIQLRANYELSSVWLSYSASAGKGFGTFATYNAQTGKWDSARQSTNLQEAIDFYMAHLTDTTHGYGKEATITIYNSGTALSGGFVLSKALVMDNGMKLRITTRYGKITGNPNANPSTKQTWIDTDETGTIRYPARETIKIDSNITMTSADGYFTVKSGAVLGISNIDIDVSAIGGGSDTRVFWVGGQLYINKQTNATTAADSYISNDAATAQSQTSKTKVVGKSSGGSGVVLFYASGDNAKIYASNMSVTDLKPGSESDTTMLRYIFAINGGAHYFKNININSASYYGPIIDVNNTSTGTDKNTIFENVVLGA